MGAQVPQLGVWSSKPQFMQIVQIMRTGATKEKNSNKRRLSGEDSGK